MSRKGEVVSGSAGRIRNPPCLNPSKVCWSLALASGRSETPVLMQQSPRTATALYVTLVNHSKGRKGLEIEIQKCGAKISRTYHYMRLRKSSRLNVKIMLALTYTKPKLTLRQRLGDGPSLPWDHSTCQLASFDADRLRPRSLPRLLAWLSPCCW